MGAAAFQRIDRSGDGEIGFSRTRRSERQYDGTFVDGIKQLLLHIAEGPDILYIFPVALVLEWRPAARWKKTMHISGFFMAPIPQFASRYASGHVHPLAANQVT